MEGGEDVVALALGVHVPGSAVGVEAPAQHPGPGFTHATPETVTEPDDVIIVTGKTPAVEAFAELTQASLRVTW